MLMFVFRRLAAPSVLALGLAAAVTAQPVAPDSSVRDLGDVTVRGAAAPAGVARIPVVGAVARDAASVADLAPAVPSAVAPTNSRGETLLYVRGAGERQTAVLLDGAPLTVSWDRRLDLSLVPVGAIGALDLVRGPASLAAGPNAAGGVLDLGPRDLDRPGTSLDVDASGGLPTQGRIAATALGRRGTWSATASLDAQGREGAALAAPLPFSQVGDGLRTNTDRRTMSGLARLAWTPWPGAGVAATVLHLDAAQGVAPEGHLDPRAERVRFWRIPAWRQSTAVVRGRTTGPVRLDAVSWVGAFDQTIEAYPDVRYEAPDETQADRDLSAGARAVVEADTRVGVIRAVGWARGATHRTTVDGASAERFRDVEGRLAAEAEGHLGRARILVGTSLDRFVPLEAGGRDLGDGFWLPGVVARVDAPAGDVRVFAGVSRGGRFPTMRELFGAALGRFALNPALEPETTWQVEAGAGLDRNVGRVRVTAFGRWTDGAIEQDVLPDGRRQRVNLGGSRAVGVEAEATARRGPVRFDASGMLLSLRGGTDGRWERLPERPSALGRVAVATLPARGWTGAFEVLAVGPAISLGPTGVIDLPPSLRVGARIGRRWALPDGTLGVYARVDNVTDAEHLPQAGLPAPGREVRIGLTWSRWSR
ncbi:MAG: TonB-dependent receptor [Bacteroidota bacterium]